jgi:hypothetical protein
MASQNFFREVRRDCVVVCLAVWIFATPSTRSQTADQSQNRAQLFRNQPSPTYGPNAADGEEQGYAVASPNDKDLGEQQILKRREEYLSFSFSVSTPVYYTNNVALTPSGEEDDVLFSPGMTFTYQPRLTKTLYAEIGVAQQFFLYDRFSELDFSSFDAIAGIAYYLPQFHNLSLRARYDYNRLTDTDDFDEFFVNHSYLLSASMPFRIGRAQQVAFGVDTQLSFWSHPDAPRRNDYSFFVGYSVNLSRSFSIDSSARLAVRDYHVGDRTDVSEILALSANYRISEWLILSFLSSFAWNQSNHSAFDYDVANVGGGAALVIRF